MMGWVGAVYAATKKDDLTFFWLALLTATMKISDVIVSTGGGKKTCEFVVFGEPVAQNGWKLAFKGRFRPYLYDGLKDKKTKLRQAVATALKALEEPTPFFTETILKVSITFGLRSVLSKDLDNLAKFFLDAIEGAAFDDNKRILELNLKKKTDTNPNTTISITTF